MAFEQVRVRLPDGQEFGPVAWSAMLQWHQEGRVPADAYLVDHATGEARPAASFPALQRIEVTPTVQAQSYVPPTPAPIGITDGYHTSNTPPDSSIGTVFSYGWAAVMKHIGLAIGGTVIFILLVLVCAFPILSFLALPFIAPPLIGGAVRFGLNIVNDNYPQIGDLFSGFTNYLRWLGLFWLLIAIVLVIEIPLLIYSVTYSLSHALTTGRDITAEPIYWLLAIPTMIVVAAVTLRFAFAYPLVAEGYGVLDAMRVSNQMVTGRGWYTFLVMLLLYLIYVAGALALIVGILFTIPVAFTIYGCYYNAVKAEAGVG